MTKYFTASHEWLLLDGDEAVVGITDYAQTQLGDVVFVELPTIGSQFETNAEAAVVESVKAASEIYMPVAGEVIAINEALADDPSLVNRQAEAAGWFFKCRLTAPEAVAHLMDEAAYQAHIKEIG